MNVKVGSYEVEVRGSAYPSVVCFKKSTGNKNGAFAFWRAVFKKKIDGRKGVIGRATIGLSAGDRFDRMKKEMASPKITKEDRAIYRRFWKSMEGGKNLKFIRPATDKEIKRWLDTHKEREFGVPAKVIVKFGKERTSK